VIARGWHAAVAALVLVALIVQIVIAVRLPSAPVPGNNTGFVQGTDTIGRLIRIVSFFTIESNILSGIVSAQLAVRPDRDGPQWRALRLAALFGITVTGIVYSTVLAPIHEPKAGAETFVNTIVHYVVPIAMVIGWLAFGPRPRVTLATVGYSLLFPFLWLAYTLVRGAIWHWYPYPFLDVETHGYARVLLNSVAVTAAFAALAAVIAWGDRKLPPAPRPLD
jgi:hypothetical protein